MEIVDQQHIQQNRLRICEQCDFYIKLTQQCKKCGCFMKIKTKLKAMAFSGSIFGVNNTLLLKRSDTTTQEPSSLVLGELAINVADGKLFYKNSTANAIIRS